MGVTEIPVALGERSYSVTVARGSLDLAHQHLGPWLTRGRAIIVTDAQVAQAQLPRLSAALLAGGITPDPIILPAGESTKSWEQLSALCDALLQRGVERSDTILALGGGVIGDLTGFAAAIVKRGCNFIQIPTTLLAQVDSSVGGKTAINTGAGKNLIGAFHQPVAVLIDPDTLATLPRRQIAAGYAEVVKYGLIDDPAFFAWCEDHGGAILDGDIALAEQAIVGSVRAKAAIVGDDERETSGRRALLNLGHTFGHALEAEAGFSDRLLHGEAVAAGCALAFRYSARLGLCSVGDADRVAAHMDAIGLPSGLAPAGINASGAMLAAHMAHDKKASGGKVPFLLARGIGQTFLAKDVDLADVAAFLDGEAR
jgi:3-dehydroquinate synthase